MTLARKGRVPRRRVGACAATGRRRARIKGCDHGRDPLAEPAHQVEQQLAAEYRFAPSMKMAMRSCGSKFMDLETTSCTSPERAVAETFCLFSCFLSGQPAAAIAALTVCPPAEEGGEPEYVIFSLFISTTDDMVLTDHDGAAPQTPESRPRSPGAARMLADDPARRAGVDLDLGRQGFSGHDDHA